MLNVRAHVLYVQQNYGGTVDCAKIHGLMLANGALLLDCDGRFRKQVMKTDL